MQIYQLSELWLRILKKERKRNLLTKLNGATRDLILLYEASSGSLTISAIDNMFKFTYPFAASVLLGILSNVTLMLQGMDVMQRMAARQY